MKQEYELYVKVPKDKISLFTKIIEGYDNLGIVSTINPEEGLTVIRFTPGTAAEIRKVAADLPFAAEIIELKETNG